LVQYFANETKHHAKILAKRWLFSILDFDLKRPKKSKKSLRRLHEDNRFCSLDGTKHDPENFSILHHSKVVCKPLEAHFGFFWPLEAKIQNRE